MLRNSYFVLRHEDGVALGSICAGEPPRGGGRGASRGHRRSLNPCRVGTDPIAAPSTRRCQVVATIAVITPYYIYSVALMAQLRTLITEMLSKNCTKVALCAQFA